MHKKTIVSAHFLPRTGSYSTHPKRNGAVDVLPPHAREALYDISAQVDAGEARVRDLVIKKDHLFDKLQFRRRVQGLQQKHSGNMDASEAQTLHLQIQAVDQEIGQLRRYINSLRALLKGAGVSTLEQAFTRIAEAELSPDVYGKILDKARRILAAAKGR